MSWEDEADYIGRARVEYLRLDDSPSEVFLHLGYDDGKRYVAHGYDRTDWTARPVTVEWRPKTQTWQEVAK